MAVPTKSKTFRPGRPRVKDPKSSVLRIRCTPEQVQDWTERAARAGLTVGSFARTVLDGSPGPRAKMRVSADRKELARLVGMLGMIRGNHHRLVTHQLAHKLPLETAELRVIGEELVAMRSA